MVLAFILSLAAAVVALQFPSVQTCLTRRVMEKLAVSLDGDVEIGSVYLRPFNTLVLKNVIVKDRNPAPEAGDTLFSAGTLTASLGLSGLTAGEGLHLGTVRLEDAALNLVIEDSTTSLQRIFRLKKRDPDKPKNMSKVFDIRKAVISNFRFTMKNLRTDKDHREGGIDWNNLDVVMDEALAREIRMDGGEMGGRLEHAILREKSGFTCGYLSADAVVGNGRTLLENLRLSDGNSDLDIPNFVMSYANGNRDFSDFIHLVTLDGDIRPSRLSLSTLKYFSPSLDRFTMDALIEGRVHGTVDDLHTDGLRLQTCGGGFSIDLTGSIMGIPDTDGMFMDFDIDRMDFTTASLSSFLRGWAPDSKLDLSKFAKKTDFLLTGGVKGTLDSLAVDVGLSSRDGCLDADLLVRGITDKVRPIRIDGTASTEDLDVGNIVGSTLIRETSLSTAFRANLGNAEEKMEVAIDSLTVDRASIKGYDYSGLAAVGSFDADGFFGTVVCDDPNLNFLFQGALALSSKTNNAVYKFFANVGYADLNAIHLDKRGLSRAKFATTANFNRTGKGDMLGSIDVTGIELENSDGRHNIGNISISSHQNDDVFRGRFNSSFANGSFKGTAPLAEFVRDLLGITLKKETPSLFRDASYEWKGNSYDLSFYFQNTRDILSFVLPGMYIADKTGLSLKIDGSGNMDADIISQRIAYRENFAKDLSVHLDNRSEILKARLETDDASLAGIKLENGVMKLSGDNDLVDFTFLFRNDGELRNGGEIYATADLDRCEGVPDYHVSILPSSLTFNSDTWTVKPSRMRLEGGKISIEGFELTNGEQHISASGALAKDSDEELKLHMDRFSIAFLNALIKGELGLKGMVSGDAVLTSSEEGNKGLLANLVCEGTRLGGAALGNMMLKSGWNELHKRFDMSLVSVLDRRDLIRMDGWYSPSSGLADIDARLDRVDASVAQPFLIGLFSGMGGKLSANIHAEGPLRALAISTTGGTLEDGTLTLDYTRVPYAVNGNFHVDEYGAYFDNVTLTDAYGGRGRIQGMLTYNHFYDLGTDLRITFREMELLSNREEDNAGFYGNLSGSGSVAVKGPVNDIFVDINARTSGPGAIHIPLSGSSTSGKSNLLTFKQEEKVIVVDPYEEMLKNLNHRKKKSGSNLSVNIQAVADQDVEAFLEIDKASGNVLTGRGYGNIGLEVNPGKGIFNLKGDYTINTGNYKFVALGLASRDFTIQEGSTVKFAGDVMETTLNIDALYKTKASISTLISDTTSVNTRKTVECGINITDKLSNPHVAFSINVPDVEPTVKAKVQNALMTEDKIQKQFLSLILSNNFLPDEQSGIVNNSSLLYSNMSEIMSNQLNNILQKLDIPLDLGFNYQPNEKGNDIFDVAVSTQLFNNRVIVNGNFGNNQYSRTGSQQDFVGDLDVEIKLDRQGHLRMSLFSHSADQYSNYLDNSQRNGAGLVYQMEYDSFVDYLKDLFTGKKKRRRPDHAVATTDASSTESSRREARRLSNMDRKTIHIEKEDR
ncbi:MAG: translocation/assembly module TamB domain-containing protein [Bacteroidales bacterium]|nr:translocation/assembly module TamB domain-containing protein [Bacteroidales bacterium]